MRLKVSQPIVGKKGIKKMKRLETETLNLIEDKSYYQIGRQDKTRLMMS